MSASRLSRPAGLTAAVVAGLLALSTASYAASYEQLFPGGAPGASHSEARGQYPVTHSRAQYRIGYPDDYVSSHVCVNGYRWITRQLNAEQTPEDNAIPVRC